MLKRIKSLFKPIIVPPLTQAKKALHRRQLRSELPGVSYDDLIRDLAALQLPTGRVVIVHSSLKSLGFVDGGPRTVVEALAEIIVRRHGGTLVMPTFSIAGTMLSSLAAAEVFDVRSTPCNLGAIPETFRTYPGVLRSIHPTHSFAALGPKAGWIVKDHHTAETSFGDHTPMVRALDDKGWILGLGTGLGNVTFYHCLEDREADFPIEVYAQRQPYKVSCIDQLGRAHTLELRGHDSDVSRTRIDRPENDVIRSFFTKRLEEKAGLRWCNVGRGRCWYLSLQKMYAECKDLMDAGVTIYTSPQSLDQLGFAEFSSTAQK